jgi:phenylacetate-CoA oxygenase PaaI subunit
MSQAVSQSSNQQSSQQSGPRPLIKLDETNDQEAQQLAAQATSLVIEKIDSVTALDVAARAPLYALLSSLADNKFVLGKQYVAWCTGAPILESAIAAAAMAQDEMGHARSLYPLLRGFPEATDEATREAEGWASRPTSALACLDEPFESWVEFVAANFVVDTALTVLFEAATESGYEPLGQRARKIVQEEAYHWTHALGWLQRLAADPRQRPHLAAALASVWDDAFAWYGPSDDPVISTLWRRRLLAAGPNTRRAHLRDRLRPGLEQAGLAGALFERELPWQRWRAAERRLSAAS